MLIGVDPVELWETRQRRPSAGLPDLRSGDSLSCSYDSAILLLHLSLVILGIGTAAREVYPDLIAIIPHDLVHDAAINVGIQPEQQEGQQLASPPPTAAVHGPAAAHIRSSPWRCRSAPKFEASCSRDRPAVRHQARLAHRHAGIGRPKCGRYDEEFEFVECVIAFAV
jgi:hypothetical protein